MYDSGNDKLIFEHIEDFGRRQSLYHSTTYVIDGSDRQLSSSQHTNHTALDYYPNKVCLIFLYVYYIKWYLHF